MTRRLLFDIESNGLLPSVSKVHCIVATDVDTDEVFCFTPETIEAGLDLLYNADELMGHNIIAYDLRVLFKLYKWGPRPGTKLTDTLVVSRLKYPALAKDDDKSKPVGIIGRLIGSHSLKAWGIRLGEFKSEYNGGWEEFSQEMLDYCVQDNKTNVRLLRHLKPWEYPQAPLTLEHLVAEVVAEIEQNGWPFDTKKAQELYAVLCGKRDVLERSLAEKFGSWQQIDKQYIAKKDNKKRGIKKGDLVTNWKTVTFNPGSRVHIEKKLREAGWMPEKFTPTGRAQIDDEVLEDLTVPGAQELVDYLLIQKRLGQIGDGDNAWLKRAGEDGLIHCEYNPMGTTHSRASHNRPNIGQVPNAGSLYGPECRELFKVPEGWSLVGADMAGAQLRCLAHYISFFDGGSYGEQVVDGDIHTLHQQAAAPFIPTRDASKKTIYAFLYGAGPPKIGSINGQSAQTGRRIIELLKTKVLGLGKLMRSVEQATEKGYIKGLDGRLVPTPAKRLGLNYLVTSAEAILCKNWLVSFRAQMETYGYTCGWGGDYVIVGYIHDELQVACKEALADFVGETLVKCAEQSGDNYNFKTRLNSDYKVGKTWKDTH